MFQVYEITTGEPVNTYADERLAWSHAYSLNDNYSEAMGLEYSVRQIKRAFITATT